MNFQEYKDFKQQFIIAISDGDISAFAAKKEISQLSQEQFDDLQFSLLAIIVKERREHSNFDTDVKRRCGHAYGEIENIWNEIHTDETEEQQQESESNSFTENGNCMTAGDLLLRTFFGNHLTGFLKEAQICKDGTAVARLVNWYINEYGLDNGGQYRKKPLHDVLFAKGIIKIGVNGWNKAIK